MLIWLWCLHSLWWFLNVKKISSSLLEFCEQCLFWPHVFKCIRCATLWLCVHQSVFSQLITLLVFKNHGAPIENNWKRTLAAGKTHWWTHAFGIRPLMVSLYTLCTAFVYFCQRTSMYINQTNYSSWFHHISTTKWKTLLKIMEKISLVGKNWQPLVS